MTATPNAGYTFTNWTENGNPVSTNTNYTFTVTGNRNLVAHFQLQSFTVTATADPSNGGTVTGGGTYNYNESCTVTATLHTGYTFINWTENGNPVSINVNYTFTVTGNRNLVAHFQLQSFTVTATADPINGGTVIGGGTYNYNESCTVTATPNAGYIFVNWTENGNPVSTYPSYTFTVTGNRNLVAHFTTQSYVITAMSDPVEGGTVTGTGGYNYGESCTLSATANTGYEFQRWTKNGTVVSQDPSYTFIVTESAAYIAHFTAQTYTVTVSSNPSDGGAVSGGGTYAYGQTCTVHASANSCYTLDKWTENGNMVCGSSAYSFVVTDNRSLVADFTMLNYTIFVNIEPAEGGYVIGAGSHPCGEAVTLEAVANENYSFVGWYENGQAISFHPSMNVIVNGDRHLMALFDFFDGVGEDNGAVNIYPNPSKDVLHVTGKGIKSVKVFTVQGQLVESMDCLQRDRVLLDMGKYEAGVYVMEVVTESGKTRKQFVKQ